jgi:LysR family transcriptional activator of nhaA
MEWLNYHHLRYFWAAAREGSVTRASEKLNISQPTVSAQIRELEDALGEKLFARTGRSLVLTDMGRLVYRYADEIFSLGRELLESVRDRPTGRPVKLAVGIANSVPKLIAYRLLHPAFKLPEAVQLECLEDSPERLIGELAVHGLDLVISDAPVGANIKVRAYNHLLGECGVSVFGSEALAAAHKGPFPRSLDGAPWLLPSGDASLRRSLDQWFDGEGLRVRVAGEFADSALMKVFGEAGEGFFVGPTVIAKEIAKQYKVCVLGEMLGLKERFYAITVERRIKHPAVAAISEAARRGLFA